MDVPRFRSCLKVHLRRTMARCQPISVSGLNNRTLSANASRALLASVPHPHNQRRQRHFLPPRYLRSPLLFPLHDPQLLSQQQNLKILLIIRHPHHRDQIQHELPHKQHHAKEHSSSPFRLRHKHKTPQAYRTCRVFPARSRSLCQEQILRVD